MTNEQQPTEAEQHILDIARLTATGGAGRALLAALRQYGAEERAAGEERRQDDCHKLAGYAPHGHGAAALASLAPVDVYPATQTETPAFWAGVSAVQRMAVSV